MNSPEAAYEEALEKIHHALKTSQKELNFDSQNLHALPQEIGQLKSLTSLSLSGNKLKSLPPEIGSLNSLTSLNLSTNSFENFPRGLIQLTNLRELDLRNNKLDSLPSNINFHYLQSLNLGNNVFKTIPPQIFQFKLLNKLSLHSNKLDNVAPEISKLECLTYLDINLNELESIPSAIFKLIRLQHLFLAGNRINAIVPGIKSLIKLLTLDLNSNRINIITSEIGRLKSLQVLYLYKNLLTSLPKEIGELEKLEILELSDNNISNLPPEIKHLNNLRHLSLHNNKLESIPPEIGQLVQATKMDLSKNQISDIPTTIGQLKNLKSLILSSNKIITLPKEIVLLTRLTDLYLNNNLLVNLPKQLSKLVNLKKLLLEDNKLLIPPEILSLVNDPSAIVQYYSTIVSDDSRPLHEAKMILVGQGSVGKTSLVNRLIKNSFNPMEEKTKGITKNRLQINVNSQLYAVNIWDFGGQEIMHSTHQFFLTHRALYLLVFDTRLEEIENRLNYWLKIIRSFGGNSPIILVGNKIDQHPLDLDKRALLENFPQIKAIMPISCLTNSGISALMEKISHEISNLPDINNKIPISWFKVKERLETLSYKYISYEDFDKICEEEEIQGTINKKTVLHFLHDLGTVLSFQDDSSISLQQTQVLRPEWVTNGVYKIINSPTILRNGGIFSWSDLNNTLDESLYPRKIHKAFIVDLMQKFEICFSHDINGEISYLIPDLLSKESIDTGNWDDSLSIQYNYD
ncbi:MAG: leucine-rich repeat domain-containing protein, partial [Anaerolineae bacterium]|nr:leucine-rich repeat domain-containing protein [Anaerolineae bacterium]